MIDMSPEALGQWADELAAEFGEGYKKVCTLRALAAEKRAAQNGVTDAYRVVCESIVKHQFQDDHRRGRLTVDVETLLHEINARRAALEAVWPGKDAPDEYESEVWQDGNLVAEESSTSAQEVLKEADHYAAIYGQDGPVEVKFYARRALTRAAMESAP